MSYIAQERNSTLPSILQDGRIIGTCEIFRASTKDELENTSMVSQRIAIGVLVQKGGQKYALWYDTDTQEFAYCLHPRSSYGD